VATAARAAAVIGSAEEPVAGRWPPFAVVPAPPVDDDPADDSPEPPVELPAPPAEPPEPLVDPLVDPPEPLVEPPVEPVDPPPVTSSVMSALSLALLGSNGRGSVLSATEPLACATRLSIFNWNV